MTEENLELSANHISGLSDEIYDAEVEELSSLPMNSAGADVFLLDCEILKARDEAIKEAEDGLMIERDDAILALIKYKWNLEVLLTEWYDDVESSKIKCGIVLSKSTEQILAEKGVVSNGKNCLICFEEKSDKFFSLSCGHQFCSECWREFSKEHAKNPLSLLFTK